MVRHPGPGYLGVYFHPDNPMNVQKLCDILKFMAIGAFSFWLPDTMYHAIRGEKFGGRDVLAITVLMPLTLLGAYLLVGRRRKNEGRVSIGWPMILGVWLLGGFFITISASFSGGGFAGADGFAGGINLILMSLLPIVTFMMATYDGSLGSLSIVSFGAVIIWLIVKQRSQHNL